MSVTISFQPDPRIETPTGFKVWRKANTSDASLSYLEDGFSEVAALEITNPALRAFTDPDGEEGYWYRMQTYDATHVTALGYPLPGHNRSAFCSLRAGFGWLSAFTPSALTDAEIWDVERDATVFVVERYMRPKYTLAQIVEYYEDPLPSVRQLTELIAAKTLVGRHRPQDDDQLKAMSDEVERISAMFVVHQTKMSHDVEEVSANRDPQADVAWDFDR